MNILQEWLAESTVFDTYFHFFLHIFSKLARIIFKKSHKGLDLFAGFDIIFTDEN